MAAQERSGDEIALALAGAALAITLLAIGPASHEMVRHIVQAAPVALATVVAFAWPALGRWALGPCFAVWLGISLGIWLFILGLPSPFEGIYNFAERALAAMLGVVSLAGFALFPRIRRPMNPGVGLLCAVVALAAQMGAIAFSLRPVIAHI